MRKVRHPRNVIEVSHRSLDLQAIHLALAMSVLGGSDPFRTFVKKKGDSIRDVRRILDATLGFRSGHPWIDLPRLLDLCRALGCHVLQVLRTPGPILVRYQEDRYLLDLHELIRRTA